MGRIRSISAVALLGPILLGGIGGARAEDDEATPIDASLVVSGRDLVATFSVSHVFSEAFRRRITGGLRANALIEVRLFDADGDVVGEGLRHCKFRMRPWEDFLTVSFEQTGRAVTKKEPIIDRGLQFCGDVDDLALSHQDNVDLNQRWDLEIVVRLNAFDEESLETARAFLSNPRGRRLVRPPTFFERLAQLFSPAPERGGERIVFRAIVGARRRGR